MSGGGEKSGFSLEILLIKPKRRRVLSVLIGGVSCGRMDWIGIVVPQ